MRWIGIIFLIFVMFPATSSAAYTYIKVTKTQNTKKLQSIRSNLQKMGQQSTYRTTKQAYIIYSGPYKNTRSAKYALQKIKRYFPYAKIVKTKVKPTTKKTKKRVMQRALKTSYKQDQNGFFVGAALGYSNAALSKTGNVEIYAPQESGISYDLQGGYRFKNSIFVALGYLRSDESDIVFDNLYTSVNYKFGPYGDFSPYFGLLAGYSKLTWNKNPLDNTSASNSSDSFFGGTQIGAIYKGLKVISLYANYQCLFMNHTTVVKTTTATSNLEHKTLHNIQLGVRYNF